MFIPDLDFYPSRFSDTGLGSNNNKRGGGEIKVTNLKKNYFIFVQAKKKI
jgi:hypothetical protein